MRRHDVIALLTCDVFGLFPCLGNLEDPVRSSSIGADLFPLYSPVSLRRDLVNLDGNSAGRVWNQGVSLGAERECGVYVNGSESSLVRPGAFLSSCPPQLTSRCAESLGSAEFQVRLFANANRSDVVEFATDSAASKGLKAVRQTTETHVVARPFVAVDPVLC